MKKLRLFIVLCTFLLAGCGVSDSREQTQTSASLETQSALEEESGTETESETETEPETEDLHEYDFTVCFAGDINLDEDWETTQMLDSVGGDIYKCISPELIEIMNAADIMCLNNEFTYSTGGSALSGKAYTFRADPSRVEILKALGVDVVTLANNHVYDYGQEALLDTFDTLDEAGIEYFGAGRDLSEAMEPVYIEVDGKIVAFVGASRAEKYQIVTEQATETSAGILRCYDTELFLEVIEEAAENADFVIAYVHWGTEYQAELEDVQLETGRLYLDAGCDIVIGAHSHCLQGMEYYNGKAIVYSLGNYWFNDKTLDTMLLELHFYGNDEEENLEITVIPAIQTQCTTIIADEEEAQRIYSYLEEISINITIDENGMVAEN